MEQQITNKEILEKLNQIQMDINVIKERLDDAGEFSDWTKGELSEARKRKDKMSHEEIKKIIFAK
ncbi:MAG: hypothetical protein AABX16_02555 [Nanoarchaeota archaeon]